MTWKRYHRYDGEIFDSFPTNDHDGALKIIDKFSDIMDFLDYLASEYPQLVKVKSIGKSYEDRALKIIKISSGPGKNGEPKPAIWIDAGSYNRSELSRER